MNYRARDNSQRLVRVCRHGKLEAPLRRMATCLPTGSVLLMPTDSRDTVPRGIRQSHLKDDRASIPMCRASIPGPAGSPTSAVFSHELMLDGRAIRDCPTGG